MKRPTGRKPASNVAQYNRLSGNIFRSLDFMITLHPRIWEKLAANSMVTPMQNEMWGKPAAPSLHPRFCWNMIGITDEGKATNHVNTIQSPNAKTIGSITNLQAAFLEECWSISLMFLASRSISALYLLSPVAFRRAFARLWSVMSPLISRRKTAMTFKRYTFASS